MNPDLHAILLRRLLAIADDELILGHRNSEWCGHAPILEEDIAFANIALDEIGHAVLWYGLVADLSGKDRDRYPDQLVYLRPAEDFRNVQLVELPKGDWAFTILRQYLFDMAEAIFLEAWLTSTYSPAAEVAAKIRNEEFYHRRHAEIWVRRLGLGTADSHRRMQAALQVLWAYSLQLFLPEPGDYQLVREGIFPDPREMGKVWRASVRPFLEQAGLSVPVAGEPAVTSRKDHSNHLQPLIRDLQSLPRTDPDAVW